VHDEPRVVSAVTRGQQTIRVRLPGGGDTPVARAGVEGVALVGWNPEDGASYGVIGAVLGSYGTHENNAVVATGKEWMNGEEPQNIELREVNIGLPLWGIAGLSGGVGYYDTGKECGVYVHASGNIFGEHGAVGFGTSTARVPK
jgi:hypothetical protein